MNKAADVLRELSLSESEIADRSKLPLATVRSILAGGDPTLADLRALSRGLRIPLRVFATGLPALKSEQNLSLLFRNTPGKERRQYEVTVESVASFVDASLKILPNRIGNPQWLSAFDYSEETYAEAHRLAELFRMQFIPDRQDEPIPDLAQVIDAEGLAVIGRLNFSQYEGASVIAGGHAFVFVSPRFASRMLFTLAHELGHIIAHHRFGHAAIFERASSIGRARSKSRSEAFVDAFASILLLPDQGVGRTLKTVRDVLRIDTPQLGDIEILLLARIYGVSFDVAARRCENLDLLPAGGAVALVDELKRAHGSAERRAKSANLPPRVSVVIPRVSSSLLQLAVEKVKAGEVSAGWLCDQLGISVEELYAAHAGPNIDSELRH
ncbi:ImmA/IrrE family metallo-endopeptidase [Ferrovibrio sp.]|uniref:ImmA/IrrE family metallo-endopeptidase n=1 Tax=Ferrovibrio sp. TaxID=1917215 RepID=UPI003514CCC3